MARTDIDVLARQITNCYRTGVAVVVSASNGAPLHGAETFSEGGPGQHLCVSFPDVDEAAFQRANVAGALEQARKEYLRLWKLRQDNAV